MGRRSSGTPFHASLRSCAMMSHLINTPFALQCKNLDAPILTSSLVIQATNFCLRFERMDCSRMNFSELSAVESRSSRECHCELL